MAPAKIIVTSIGRAVAGMVLAVGLARASSSLAFEGGGYWLDLEVGHADRDTIASIDFHRPGDARGVVVRSGFHVEVFDIARHELRLVHEGAGDVPAFTLTVHGDAATLQVGREQVSATFDWAM